MSAASLSSVVSLRKREDWLSSGSFRLVVWIAISRGGWPACTCLCSTITARAWPEALRVFRMLARGWPNDDRGGDLIAIVGGVHRQVHGVDLLETQRLHRAARLRGSPLSATMVCRVRPPGTCTGDSEDRSDCVSSASLPPTYSLRSTSRRRWARLFLTDWLRHHSPAAVVHERTNDKRPMSDDAQPGAARGDRSTSNDTRHTSERRHVATSQGREPKQRPRRARQATGTQQTRE